MTPVTEPKVLRDAAMLTLAQAGYTAEQIAALDVDGMVILPTPRTGDAIIAWLSVRARINPPTPALFVSLHWGHGAGPNLRRLSARSVRRIISA